MNDSKVPEIHKRYMRNIILSPSLQFRLGAVSVIVALFFSAITAGLVYIALSDLYLIVLDLTGARQVVTEILDQEMSDLSLWLFAILVAYLLVNIFLSVYYTHRLVGPTVAFRRHITSLIEGNLESRVILRKNDAFTEVAADLNELAEALQKNKSKE